MINSTIAEKIIRKVFQNAEIKVVMLYKKGFINRNYLIKTLNPNKEFILRIFPRDNWKAEKERYVYGMISKKIDLPIPHIYLFDDSKKLIRYSYLLLSKINGVELDMAYKKTGNEKLIILSGEYLARIHSIKFPKFGWITNKGIEPEFTSWTDFLEYDFNEKLAKLKMIRGFSNLYIKKSKEYFKKKVKALETNDVPCLLHKDYHFAHILANDSKITGIIDVEWAIAGNNELDLAKSIMWMFEQYPELERYFLEGYKKHGKISNSFLKRREIYNFLILISSLSLAYEYKNMAWFKEHWERLRILLR